MTLWPGHPDRNPFSGEVGHGHVFDAEQQRETSVSEVLYSGQYWWGQNEVQWHGQKKILTGYIFG